MAKINIKKIKEEYQKDQKQNDFELLPDGDYPCFVYDLEGGVSKNDNPKISVTLKVANGDYQNRQLWTNLTLISKAWFKVEEFFEAIDKDIDMIPDGVETAEQVVAAIKNDILGSKVIAQIGRRKWEGNEYNDVKKLKKPEKDFAAEDAAEDAPF